MLTGAGRDVLERRSLSNSSNPREAIAVGFDARTAYTTSTPQRPPHARRCNYFV
jgi:hypothetical protein